jgi:hypothetical protein
MRWKKGSPGSPYNGDERATVEISMHRSIGIGVSPGACGPVGGVFK